MMRSNHIFVIVRVCVSFWSDYIFVIVCAKGLITLLPVTVLF